MLRFLTFVLSAAMCGTVATDSGADDKKEPAKAVKVTATELMKEFERSAEKFKEKYKDKRLEIEGEVFSVEPDAKLVRLRCNKGDGVVKMAVCEFPKLPKEQFAKFKKGATATIRGTLSFFVSSGGDILIDLCEPVK
ncbi:: tRNA_anti-like [Gemmata massiliana]|uniref:: tRNA_anti-like n=1 Tax=Gemmata massiliana TaxID=1210884 RepID=A0A6P2D007_9BACT|nr:hypothetical protein [Gemmata massiliana]VTR93394.1 : tRNA_anti-like [Gemmata massiliana]